MEKFINTIQAILPVVSAIALGYFAKRRAIFSAEGIAQLKKLIMQFCLPALLFSAYYNATYSTDVIFLAGFVLLAYFIGFFLGKLFSKWLGAKYKLLPFFTTVCEIGMIGYALYAILFGQEHLSSIAIVDIGCGIFCYAFFVPLLFAQNTGSLKAGFQDTLHAPVFWAFLLGAIVGISGLGALIAKSAAGPIVQSLLNFIGAPTSFCILFVVGYGVEFSKGEIKKAAVACLLRLFAIGIMAVLLLGILPHIIAIDYHLKLALILSLILPATYMLPVCLKNEKDQAFASTCLSLYTLLTIAAFIALAIFV